MASAIAKRQRRGRRNRSLIFRLTRIFIPSDVFAPSAGNEQVESAIFIYVERADVVGFLVAGDEVVGEFSFAVVFEPPGFLVAVRAGGGVEIAIGIHIENDEGMWFFERGVDGMFAPCRCFKPDDAGAVTAAGE